MHPGELKEDGQTIFIYLGIGETKLKKRESKHKMSPKKQSEKEEKEDGVKEREKGGNVTYAGKYYREKITWQPTNTSIAAIGLTNARNAEKGIRALCI